MKIFKNANDELYEIEAGFEHMLPDGLTEITQLEADAIRAPSPEEAEVIRVNEIINKSNLHVLAKYSELKQRKLLSMAVAIQDRQQQGITLTSNEEATLQMIRDVNTWITSVRDVENAAIADGVTLAENMVLPV